MKTVKSKLLIILPLLAWSGQKDYKSLYDSITTETNKPGFAIFEMAMYGYDKLNEEGKLTQKNVITIVDFSIPSSKRRLWVIDLNQKKVIVHSLVAHGKNTGNKSADKFSNKAGSNQSSLGFYITGNSYHGKHGLSLYLDGMEKGINDKARERAIVIHGAGYVSREFINKYGRLGRSFGCPAVPVLKTKTIIN